MRFAPAVALTIAALLTGCAATVSRDTSTAGSVATTTTVSPSATKSFILEISGVGNIGTGEDWTAFLEEWQTAMTSAATNKGARFTMAKSSEAPPNGPAVLLKMKVNDFKFVSQAKRYAVGIFAGNAFMDVEVEFFELPQLRSLGTRRFKTASSAWQGVFSAMTPKQVEAVVKEIVDEVAGK